MEIYDFGLRLKSLRKSKSLSQEDVANKLNVTKSTISSYERNIITPSVEVLVDLAILYNSSVDYILGLDKRTHLFLDDLSDIQQKTILEMVDILKKGYQLEK